MKIQDMVAVAITVATGLTLVKSVFYPTVKASQVKDFSFPQRILDSEAVKSKLNSKEDSIKGKLVAATQYRNLQPNITIDARYLVDSNGDVKSVVANRISQLAPALQQNENGFYALYSYNDKAYLNACINPNGYTTVTSDRFKRNLTTSFQTSRLLPWLLGKQDLQDKRCLWSELSADLKPDLPFDATYSNLETTWLHWVNYWQQNFPSE